MPGTRGGGGPGVSVVGRICPEPVSRLGRAVMDGDISFMPVWEAKPYVQRQTRGKLKRLKFELEWLLDELTWDLEAISDPERAARVRRAVHDIRAILDLVEDRLARWDRLKKVTCMPVH